MTRILSRRHTLYREYLPMYFPAKEGKSIYLRKKGLLIKFCKMELEIDHPNSSFPKKLKTANQDIEETTSVAGSISGSQSMDNPSNSNSDLSYHDDENDEEDGDGILDDDVGILDDDYVSEYDGSDDYIFDDGVTDDYLSLQAQFDNVDLPSGVEASVSWLEPASIQSAEPACATSTLSGPSSSSAVATGPGSQDKEETVDDLMVKYVFFKRFDTVEVVSDHHYDGTGFKGQQPSTQWLKNIQNEWEILGNNLPDTIFVRVYESRMDLLTAVIVGPQGTPYHDGLFVFDAHFPPNYPDVPPLVHYYSGGLRLNPNLYECGKVCLSLLNTWAGKGNEKWVPKKSTMLQVLLSIQALILNAKPFFNEPGYEKTYVGEEGQRQSNKYNEEVFIMSLKTMMYTLRRPPKLFEDMIVGHFRMHAHDILSACKAYMDGAEVGSLVNGKLPEGTAVNPTESADFKRALIGMVNGLVSNFAKNGAKDCEQYRISR